MKCYNTRQSQCDAQVRYVVEKKCDLRHRKAYYCKECVQLFRDSEEGKKHFTVKPINTK